MQKIYREVQEDQVLFDDEEEGMPRGSKGKWRDWAEDPAGRQKVAEWLESGATNKQLASLIGIREQTLYAWINDHPEFAELITESKKICDKKVENALYKRACGYEVTETTTYTNASGEITRRKQVVKQLPPDPKSMIFWLSNRDPQTWAERLRVDNPETKLDETLKMMKEALSNDDDGGSE